jgi:hypothetical protein
MPAMRASTYRYIACLPIATLCGQEMAVDACLATHGFASTKLARLRHLVDGTEWAIDGRADVVCVFGSAYVVRVRGVQHFAVMRQVFFDHCTYI